MLALRVRNVGFDSHRLHFLFFTFYLFILLLFIIYFIIFYFLLFYLFLIIKSGWPCITTVFTVFTSVSLVWAGHWQHSASYTCCHWPVFLAFHMSPNDVCRANLSAELLLLRSGVLTFSSGFSPEEVNSIVVNVACY